MLLPTAMEEFLRYIVSRLADYPEEAVISASEDDRKVSITLRTRPTDTGKIIGRNGQIIQAIRHLLSAAAARQGKRVVFEVLD